MDVRRGLEVQPSGGVFRHHHLGAALQRPGEDQPLLVAPAQRSGGRVGPWCSNGKRLDQLLHVVIIINASGRPHAPAAGFRARGR